MPAETDCIVPDTAFSHALSCFSAYSTEVQDDEMAGLPHNVGRTQRLQLGGRCLRQIRDHIMPIRIDSIEESTVHAVVLHEGAAAAAHARAMLDRLAEMIDQRPTRKEHTP